MSSKRFFYGVVGLLVFQGLWLALSGRYPMAFDEDFHFGIIQLYAHHLSPFWSAQPAHADRYGAVFRDPSYLYQYLMSFPYRLISIWVHSQTIQVIILRFINVGLFASSLPLYRKLLLKTGAARALIHFVLLLFVLIPVVPLLAAQINYDNLLIPVVAGVLLQTYNFIAELRRTNKINFRSLTLLLISCLLGSVVKYAFLPIFAGVILFVGWELYARRRKQHFWQQFRASLTLLSRSTRWALIALLLIAAVLFGERYGINTVRYHTPIPNCHQVLSYQHCSAYGPWIRDYNYAAAKVTAGHSPIVFMHAWLRGMWERLFFTLSGPNIDYQTRGPFPFPAQGAIVFASVGLGLVLATGRRIWRKYDHTTLRLLGIVTFVYVAALWLDDFRDYLQTGIPVAINGRYLLPILPFVMLLLGLGFSEALRRWPRLKLSLAAIALLCFIWGGGFLTFVLRSNDAWYWPNNSVRTGNHAVQRVLKPITPGSNKPNDFL